MIVSKAERDNSSHHVDRSNGVAQNHIVMMDTTKIHTVVGTERIPYMVGTGVESLDIDKVGSTVNDLAKNN